MDIGYGYGGRPHTFAGRVKMVNSKLNNKTRALVGLVILFFIYKVLFSSSSSKDDEVLLNNTSEDAPTEEESFAEEVQDLMEENNIEKELIRYLTLQKPYVDPQTLSLYNYESGGNMIFGQKSEYIRLVSEKPNSVGYIFSRMPISLSDSGSFEIEFEFRIHGEQTRSSLIGDGVGVWLTSNPLEQGDLFGMQSDYHGLAVFIDTYKNSRTRGSKGASSFPYVSIQANDGQLNKYDKSRDGIATELGGCSLHRVYNVKKGSGYSKMRITYLRTSGYFQIDFDTLGNGVWKTCFTTEELGPNVIPETPYFGISAETGELFHNVDLGRVTVNALKDREGQAISSIEALLDKVEDKNDVEVDVEPQHEDRGARNRRGGGKNSRNRMAKRRHRRLNKASKGVGRQRKTASRLRNSERRLKEADAKKYGKESGFVGWFFGLVWLALKFLLYSALFVIIGYFMLLTYRIYREKQKKSMSRGLL
ncbi:hypothetical protein CANARDRAFT_27287 [[Candida] arabinofermentans NRRL YB-2248]|uniref:L-type lectin-like domain-containing protein n=1 Tax=[Candida] arabinofermentans NRRL YB-2248 TaxID=983967 RepID=A0A1E4T5D7_9ASCO|nr:hypothetical protein CANARDRAFT_27287 [[Candida] arabinofermentans NRRL YB-2248]